MIKQLVEQVQQQLRGQHVDDSHKLLSSVQSLVHACGWYAEHIHKATHPDVQGCTPEPDKVASAKAKGAQAFKNADYKSALAAYSEALRWLCPGSQAQLGSSTPVSSSNQEEASRLHSNRAQCLIKLNRPQEAVTEGDCAVRADPKSHKALYRRASAFKLAGNKSAAQQDCQSGLDLVKDLQGAAATEAASALQSLLQELGSAPDSLPASAPSQRQQKLLLQHQPQAPLLTEEVDTTWGRHMRAASALAPGTDVLTEQAAAFVLYREAQASRCWGCGAELQGDPPVPYFCPCCPLPVYCSPECQRSDAHHVPGGPECGLAWPRLLPEEGLLALRLARLEHQLLHRQQQEQGQRQGKGSMQPHTPTGAAQSLAGEVQAPPGDGKHSPVPGAASKQLLALQQLSSHEDQHRVEQRIAWAVLAVVAADLFQAAVEVAAARQPSHVAPQPRQEPQPLVEPYSILQWLYRSATNSFALTALLAPSFRLGLSKQVRLWGRGVFPQAAAFNHSCTPNVSVRFKGTMLTARATGPLQPGQQAFISYGPQVGQHMTSERLSELQAHYHFTCTCPACSGPPDQEAAWGGLRAALRCPTLGCQGSWVPPAASLLADLTDYHLQQQGDTMSATSSVHAAAAGACGNATLHTITQPAGPCPSSAAATAKAGATAVQAATTAGASACMCDGCGWDPEEFFWQYEQITQRMQRASHILSEFVRQVEEGQLPGSRTSSQADASQLSDSLQAVLEVLHPANMLLGHMLSTAARAVAVAAFRMPLGSEAAQLSLMAITMQRAVLTCLRYHYPPTAPALGFALLDLAAALQLQRVTCQHTPWDAPDHRHFKNAVIIAVESEAQAVRIEAMHILRLHFGDEEAEAPFF